MRRFCSGILLVIAVLALGAADAGAQNCPICTEGGTCAWTVGYGWLVCEVVNGVCSGYGDCAYAGGGGGDTGEGGKVPRHSVTPVGSADLVFCHLFALAKPTDGWVGRRAPGAVALPGGLRTAGSRTLAALIASAAGVPLGGLELKGSVTLVGRSLESRAFVTPSGDGFVLGVARGAGSSTIGIRPVRGKVAVGEPVGLALSAQQVTLVPLSIEGAEYLLAVHGVSVRGDEAGMGSTGRTVVQEAGTILDVGQADGIHLSGTPLSLSSIPLERLGGAMHLEPRTWGFLKVMYR